MEGKAAMKKEAAVLGFVLFMLGGFAVGILVGWPGQAQRTSGGGLEHPVKGAEGALFRIFEISDFQCPYCSKGALEVLPEVMKAYGGKVALEFRHNPLAFHPLAMPAAKASMAAGVQGRFWEMHDLIFRNRPNLAPESFVAFARQLGLNIDRFQWDAADPRLDTFIKQDLAASASLGLKGTPMFIINGIVIRGAQPATEFKKLIDAELEKASAALASGTPRDALEETLAIQNGADEKFIKYFIKGEAPQVASAPEEKKNVEGTAQVDQTVWKVPVDETDTSIGPVDAPLTIAVFSDFQCPHSARATGTLKRILEDYEGDVRLVYKNFPLPFHKEAMLAAEAALAAGAQGRFWEMHDRLFAAQDALSIADLEKHAGELKLDVSKFRSDLASHKFKEIIDSQMEQASAVGVSGTPNMFFNGRRVKGAAAFDEVKALVEEEIRKGKDLKQSGTGAPYPRILAGAKEFTPFDDTVRSIDTSDSPSRGTGKDVTLVVFSDFECPYCKAMARTVDELEKLYGDRVTSVHMDFPLDRHKTARPAALAGLAAHKQGKFWDMHDKLFGSSAHEREDLERYAAELSLDIGKFKADLDSPELAKILDNELAEGRKAGVDGTPTLFVNGRKYEGKAREAKAIAKDIDKNLLQK